MSPLPRAVVFDLDGTLIDSVPDVTAALNHMLSTFGRPPLLVEQVKEMVGWGARVMIDKALAAVGVDDVDPQRALAVYRARYLKHPADCTLLYPAVWEMLETLKADGFRLGICTNKPHDISMVVLEALGLLAFFDGVSGGGDAPFHKPDGRHITHTLARMGIPGARSVMVGDSETDASAASDAKVPFVLVDWGYRHDGPMPEADAVIAHFDQLPGIMASLLPEFIR